MKKITSLVLLLILSFAIVGCKTNSITDLTEDEITALKEELTIEFDKVASVVEINQKIDYKAMVLESTGVVSYPSDSIDTSTVGTYERVFIVTHKKYKDLFVEFVNVVRVVSDLATVDFNPPVIGGYKKVHTIEEGSKLDLLVGVSASDDVDGNIDVVVVGEYDVNVVGTYQLKYVAIDKSGNIAEERFELIVVERGFVIKEEDTTNPVISGVKNQTITVGSSFKPLNGVSATDDIDGPVPVTVSGKYDVKTAGYYIITYRATDKSGNTATAKMTLTVKAKATVNTDTTSPVISGVHNQTITVGGSFDPMSGVSATDNVDGSVTVTVSGNYDIHTAGNYTITYRATDSSGNTATESMILTVESVVVIPPDTTRPVIIGVHNQTIVVGGSFDPMAGVSAVDDVDGPVSVTVTGNYDINTAGNYTITYRASDSAGNIATETMTLVVEDGER